MFDFGSGGGLPGLTLLQGLENEILSELVCEIERVLLKTNLITHSILGSYTMSYDTLLYFEYTREFSCAYSHVHIVASLMPKKTFDFGRC